jgi:hypothetical protein
MVASRSATSEEAALDCPAAAPTYHGEVWAAAGSARREARRHERAGVFMEIFLDGEARATGRLSYDRARSAIYKEGRFP